MNKRQRKKRQRKASRRFWSLMDDPDLDQFLDDSIYEAGRRMAVDAVIYGSGMWFSGVGPQTVTGSTGQDPNSWFIQEEVEQSTGKISPSRHLTDVLYPCGKGFGRLAHGDQSRRDSFPSPYLPDGSENLEYTRKAQLFGMQDQTPLDRMMDSHG